MKSKYQKTIVIRKIKRRLVKVDEDRFEELRKEFEHVFDLLWTDTSGLNVYELEELLDLLL
jgi:hypothetical protein